MRRGAARGGQRGQRLCGRPGAACELGVDADEEGGQVDDCEGLEVGGGGEEARGEEEALGEEGEEGGEHEEGDEALEVAARAHVEHQRVEQPHARAPQRQPPRHSATQQDRSEQGADREVRAGEEELAECAVQPDVRREQQRE